MRRRTLVAAAALTALAACGGSAATGGPGGPVPEGVIGSVLPPIPEITGPLALHVEYPDSLQRITASDSNFIFGTAGTGDATLLINGEFVDVNPNGTFLAWLPVPPREAGTDSASYLVVATRGAETDSLRRWILLPPEPFAGEPGTPWIDPGSLGERPVRWMLPDEQLSLTVRAAPHAEVWLDVGSAEYEMSEIRDTGVYRYVTDAGVFRDVACVASRCGAGRRAAANRDAAADTAVLDPREAPADTLRAEVRVALNGETAADSIVLPLRILDPLRLPVAELREPPDPAGGADGIVVARPAPSGTYRWLFPDGTRATVDGREGRMWRIRLAPDLGAWVSYDDLRLMPEGTLPPTSRVGDLRFEVRDDRLTLTTWLAAAVPLEVHEPDPRTLEIVMYGVTGVTDRIAEGGGGRLFERVEWRQLPGDRYELRLRLKERVWGWRYSWATTDAGGAVLTFDVRRPPQVDASNPLAGRKIAIDPGHPGAGAHGPTGYYEGDANLAIGRILARLVREAGGTPVLIRDDTLPIGLYERTNAAIDAGADLFVSIHNNALPDGVQPIGREGTSTYHYHPHSHELAEDVQQGMLATMRLRDLGVYWGDLAVTRMSWMPSILTEGAFMMIPSHEAALMNPEFQERYARGVLQGVTTFLRDVGREERGERRLP